MPTCTNEAVLNRIIDFGNDGGSYGKSLEPKISALKSQATSSFGVIIPDFEVISS